MAGSTLREVQPVNLDGKRLLQLRNLRCNRFLLRPQLIKGRPDLAAL